MTNTGPQIQTCPNNGLPTPIEGEQFHGSLVFRGFDPDGLYSLSDSAAKIVKAQILEGDVDIVGFSPNGELLAYARSESPTIGIFTEDGNNIEHLMGLDEILSRIPGNVARFGGWWNHQWINNYLIVTSISYRQNPDDYLAIHFPVIIDALQGKWRNDLFDSLPDRASIISDPYVYFSPDLTRAVYVAETEAGWTFRIWDVLNRIPLLDSSDISIDFAFQSYPVAPDGGSLTWSPDSSRIAYIDDEDPTSYSAFPDRGVYLLDRDGGAANLITHFSNYYKTTEIASLKWSPDGKLLAFGATFNATNNAADRKWTTYNLFVYNLEKEQLVFRCPTILETLPKIIWSPDSQYLAYSGQVASPIILLDLVSGKVIDLGQQGIMVGWSETAFVPSQR